MAKAECRLLGVVAAAMDRQTDVTLGAIWVELILLGRWDGSGVFLR